MEAACASATVVAQANECRSAVCQRAGDVRGLNNCGGLDGSYGIPYDATAYRRGPASPRMEQGRPESDGLQRIGHVGQCVWYCEPRDVVDRFDSVATVCGAWCELAKRSGMDRVVGFEFAQEDEY